MRRRASLWAGLLLAVSVDMACGARSGLPFGGGSLDGAAGSAGNAGSAGSAISGAAGASGSTSGASGVGGAGSSGGASGVGGAGSSGGASGVSGVGAGSGASGASGTSGSAGAAGAGTGGFLDAGLDSGMDAGLDASPDAPVDAPLDAPPDAPADECAEAGSQEIFVITDLSRLWAYDPAGDTFRFVGTAACPTVASPFSMGVGSDGFALSVYMSGELFRIDTRTAACEPTSWVFGGGHGFNRFGMAFAPNGASDPRELLYVAEEDLSTSTPPPSQGLGTIDPSTFAFTFIGPFTPLQTPGLELASSREGRLFGYAVTNTNGTLFELDKGSGHVLNGVPLPVGTADALAVSYSGGAFYFFTTPPLSAGGGTQVTRYFPGLGAVESRGTLNGEHVVGGGVVCPAPFAGQFP